MHFTRNFNIRNYFASFICCLEPKLWLFSQIQWSQYLPVCTNYKFHVTEISTNVIILLILECLVFVSMLVNVSFPWNNSFLPSDNGRQKRWDSLLFWSRQSKVKSAYEPSGPSSHESKVSCPRMQCDVPSQGSNLQWATKVVETLLGNDASWYLSTCSILFASSIDFLITPAPQLNVV